MYAHLLLDFGFVFFCFLVTVFISPLTILNEAIHVSQNPTSFKATKVSVVSKKHKYFALVCNTHTQKNMLFISEGLFSVPVLRE